jgi:hypothetical protein
MKMKKNNLLQGILLYFLLCGFHSHLSAQPKDTLSFLHVSDIHLIFDLEKFQPDFAETRKHYAKDGTVQKFSQKGTGQTALNL